MRQTDDSMLHLEMYSNADSGHPLSKKGRDPVYKRARDDIMDPTSILDDAAMFNIGGTSVIQY